MPACKWGSCLPTSWLLFTALSLGCSRSTRVHIAVCGCGFVLCTVEGNESRGLSFGWFLAVVPPASLLWNPLPWRTASCHPYPCNTEMGVLGPAEQSVVKAVWGFDCKKTCKLSFPGINNPYRCRIQICWTPASCQMRSIAPLVYCIFSLRETTSFIVRMKGRSLYFPCIRWCSVFYHAVARFKKSAISWKGECTEVNNQRECSLQ